MIARRIASLSNQQGGLQQQGPLYNNALKAAGYDAEMVHEEQSEEKENNGQLFWLGLHKIINRF